MRPTPGAVARPDATGKCHLVNRALLWTTSNSAALPRDASKHRSMAPVAPLGLLDHPAGLNNDDLVLRKRAVDDVQTLARWLRGSSPFSLSGTSEASGRGFCGRSVRSPWPGCGARRCRVKLAADGCFSSDAGQGVLSPYEPRVRDNENRVLTEIRSVASRTPTKRGITIPRVPTDRSLVWPDGSIYRITHSSADTGGKLLEMELELPAKGWASEAPRPSSPHGGVRGARWLTRRVDRERVAHSDRGRCRLGVAGDRPYLPGRGESGSRPERAPPRARFRALHQAAVVQRGEPAASRGSEAVSARSSTSLSWCASSRCIPERRGGS